MKNALFFLFLLFVEGVFGESVSVMEGDSVTLHADLTEIKKYNVIDWRVEGILIVRLNTKANTTTYEEVPFKDRYKLNYQTGDLIITNIRTEQAGEYEISDTIHLKKKFNVTVLSQVSAGERQSVSVMEGDSVTLNTDVTETQKYVVIRWKFGGSPIAEINRNSNNIPKYVPDGSFRNQLQLDGSTGSLTIKHIEKTHSGGYEVDILRSRHTIHKSFTVSVSESGLSPAVKAVIVVLSLLVLGAVVAAGVIYIRRRISKIKTQTHNAKTMSVTAGYSVTLHTGVIDLQSTDVVMWLFGDQDKLIAETKGGENPTRYYDERFRDRLDLNNRTGSLTIMKTTITDSGRYKVKINRSGKHTSQLFILSVINPTPNEVNEREETRTPFISQP